MKNRKHSSIFFLLYDCLYESCQSALLVASFVFFIAFCFIGGSFIILYNYLATNSLSLYMSNEIIQELNEKSISKEIGGIFYSSSCFVPDIKRKEKICAPQFIIAGTMKGGTTSLYKYLQNHPLILPLEQTIVKLPKGNNEKREQIIAMGDKEIRFFNKHYYNHLLSQYSPNILFEHYLKFFPQISMNINDEINYHKGYITGEASPTYINEPGVAQRIYNHLPAVKLIFLLRDPIDRAYSEYWFRQNYMVQKESDRFKYNSKGLSDEEIFLDCINQDLAVMEYCNIKQWSVKDTWIGSDKEQCYNEITKILNKEQQKNFWELDNPQICGNTSSSLSSSCLSPDMYSYCNPKSAMLGSYVFQLKEYFDIFSLSLIKIIESEEFYSKPIKILKDLEIFLNIDKVSMEWDNIAYEIYNMATINTINDKNGEIISKDNTTGFILGHFNTSSDYPPLSNGIRKYLAGRFKIYNYRLETLLGRKFAHWSI